MAKERMNIFLNLISSGKYYAVRDEKNMDIVVRYIILNFLIFMGGSLLFGFAFSNFRIQNNAEAIVDFVMGLTTVAAFIILRTKAPFLLSGFMTVIPFGILCAFFFYGGGTALSGIFWSFTFPMMAIFLLGIKFGTGLSILLWIFMGFCALFPGFSPIVFERAYASRILSVYILILALTMVYEQTKMTKDKWVMHLTSKLKEERDTITAMKDNLKVGLFLMDDKGIIQGQYSKALEDVLMDNDLEGQSFTDLLSASIKQKELETLKDYFTMVLEKTYDVQMLEDINPIYQFRFVHPVSKDAKTLRTLFSSLERDNGDRFILCSITDATKEAELQEQLSEEEDKRQAEMQTMFEVIHVEPRVLNDFIEDTDYEFNRINTVLKNRAMSSRQVMMEMYQSIHAIKSNAVILGLDSFSNKLHDLEDRIKDLRDKEDDVSFDDVLSITFDLENIMKVKDSFKEIIDKITSFTKGTQKMQEEFVLVELLKRTAEKAAESGHKMVVFDAPMIDPAIVNGKNRRAIKEILLQLVRNSVFHGIEEPEYRIELGKEKVGLIELTAKTEGDVMVIELRDNGKGLDFDAIAQKALTKHLITEAQAKDKSVLTKIIFSSGFSTAEQADMYAGRGVGLNLVKDRVKELGGTIKLQSEKGKGTKFIITVPAA
jgi:two-component system chemotaxis sensor kinase CheA